MRPLIIAVSISTLHTYICICYYLFAVFLFLEIGNSFEYRNYACFIHTKQTVYTAQGLAPIRGLINNCGKTERTNDWVAYHPGRPLWVAPCLLEFTSSPVLSPAGPVNSYGDAPGHELGSLHASCLSHRPVASSSPEPVLSPCDSSTHRPWQLNKHWLDC